MVRLRERRYGPSQVVSHANNEESLFRLILSITRVSCVILLRKSLFYGKYIWNKIWILKAIELCIAMYSLVLGIDAAQNCHLDLWHSTGPALMANVMFAVINTLTLLCDNRNQPMPMIAMHYLPIVGVGAYIYATVYLEDILYRIQLTTIIDSNRAYGVEEFAHLIQITASMAVIMVCDAIIARWVQPGIVAQCRYYGEVFNKEGKAFSEVRYYFPKEVPEDHHDIWTHVDTLQENRELFPTMNN